MKITEQQIEAEIAELRAEADRKVASVKAIFMESARLRKQAEHLDSLLELRKQADRHPELISFIMIGFVREDENDEPKAFCVFTWSGSANAPTEVRIHLKSDWQRVLPINIAPYFKDLLDDWTQTVQTQPEMVLAMLAELSVGPLRTMEQGTMHRDRVALLVQDRLGDVLRFPGVVLVK